MSGSWDNSTNQSINMTVGGVAAAGTGDYTVVVFVQTAATGNSSWLSGMVSAAIGIEILSDTGLWFGAADFSSGFGAAAASTWYMAGQSKASGSNTYREYLCSFGATGNTIGSPSHGVATGAGTHANPGTLTSLKLGDGDDRGNGLLAFVAIWKRVISDAEFDSICTHNLSDVAALAPDALITLDQWNGATGATDVLGTCSQTSITGAVQTGANPTGYSFALTGGATVSAPAYRAAFVVVAGKLRSLRQIARGYRPDTTPSTAIQADAGVAEADQRSTTTAAGIKGGIASGAAIAHPNTTTTSSKGAAGNGRPSARAVTTCVGVKGGIGTGTASTRNTTRNTAAKGATGIGLVVQHSATAAAKATIGTGSAPQRTTTSSATVKGGIGSGRPSARATTITAGRHQGIATGAAPTRSRTTVTAAHGATSTGRATQRATTAVVGVQVAAFTPAYVGIDGTASGNSYDSTATGTSTDGASTPTGDLDSQATAGSQDSTTTATGYV